MAFEKGTKEYLLCEAVKRHEKWTTMLLEGIQRLQMERRLLAQFPQSKENSNRQNLMASRKLSDMYDEIPNILAELDNIWNQLDEVCDEYQEKLDELSATHAKFSERDQIIRALLTMLFKLEGAEHIENQMTEMFVNEHMWKKEFSSDFLKSLHTYVKNPTEELREKLYLTASTLANYNCRRIMPNSVKIGNVDGVFEDVKTKRAEVMKNIKDITMLKVNIGILADKLETTKSSGGIYDEF